jgi:transcriptional regulator with XRE-family HTH domain
MTQIEREAFGSYLRSLRQALKLTQRVAAERIGVSSPYLTQLEKGQRNPPSRKILAEIARVYSADEATLFRAAGYLPAEESQKLLGGVDYNRLDWAFNTAVRDPRFALGTRMTKTEITPEVKAWVVELYLKSMGLNLLTEDEVRGLREAIGLETTD